MKPNRDQTPIEHTVPDWPEEGVIAVEYPLPCEKLPADQMVALHPWLRQVIDASNLSDESSQAQLQSRWSNITGEPVIRLRERFDQLTPVAIVTADDKLWGLVQRDPNQSSTECINGDIWYFYGSSGIRVLRFAKRRTCLSHLKLCRNRLQKR
jgi:hypothetical protein